MKRIGNIYGNICSMQNLALADTIARKGKSKRRRIRRHDMSRIANLEAIQAMLLNRTYKVSAYTKFKVYEPKERDVFSLPYYPDCIIQHAIMNELESIFIAMYTADTYSCIKGRGIHKAAKALINALRDTDNTKYCLKLDIKKFYPSVDHDILKQQLRRKFKDSNLLWLLDTFIDSAEGLPIGNYLSQHLSNFYLTPFDHWLKGEKRVKYYYRYADDIVVLGATKEELHQLLKEIMEFMSVRLNLDVKGNYQVFPVEARGIDFVGYRFYHKYILLRKGIKKNMARMYARRKNPQSIASYAGWAKHANTYNLLRKLNNGLPIQRLRHKDREHIPSG